MLFSSLLSVSNPTLAPYKSSLFCLSQGYGLKPEDIDKTVKFLHDDVEYSLRHGSVVIAAITSCTNTSNPSVMLAAGLLAKKACDLGLKVNPYIKTSLSPGSGVVTEYLTKSGMLPCLEQLGFNIVGYVTSYRYLMNKKILPEKKKNIYFNHLYYRKDSCF